MVVEFSLIVGPLVISQDALKKNKSVKLKKFSNQHSLSVGGGKKFLSGNDVNLQNQFNSANNT